MTLEDVKAIPREYLIPREVAAVLGTDGQSIRVWARQCPEGLGFPTVCVGNRVKIGSKSGIDKSVGDDEIRFGYPALPGMQYHRSFAVFRQLPDMAQKLREIEKRVNKLEE